MKIEWQFKDGAPMQGSSNGFWYDVTYGGYIKPAAVLSDAAELTIIRDAIETVRSFERALEAAELLNEF